MYKGLVGKELRVFKGQKCSQCADVWQGREGLRRKCHGKAGEVDRCASPAVCVDFILSEQASIKGF